MSVDYQNFGEIIGTHNYELWIIFQKHGVPAQYYERNTLCNDS